MLLMGGILLTACGSDGGANGTETPEQPQDFQEKEWNKENTFNVYYITALNDASATGNVEKVSEYINKNACVPAIVDRTDILNYADQSACQNTSTLLSFQSARFCSFVMEGYKDKNIQGSTVVLSHKLNSVESAQVLGDSFLQLIPTQVKSITKATKTFDISLATVKLSTMEQTDGIAGVLSKYLGNAYKAVVVGEVKTTLTDDLKNKLASVPSTVFSRIEPAGEYTLFVATRSNYILRDIGKEAVGSQTAYSLSIEVQ